MTFKNEFNFNVINLSIDVTKVKVIIAAHACNCKQLHEYNSVSLHNKGLPLGVVFKYN